MEVTSLLVKALEKTDKLNSFCQNHRLYLSPYLSMVPEGEVSFPPFYIESVLIISLRFRSIRLDNGYRSNTENKMVEYLLQLFDVLTIDKLYPASVNVYGQNRPFISE